MSSQWQAVTSELEGFTGVFFCLSCFSFSVWRTRWLIFPEQVVQADPLLTLSWTWQEVQGSWG